MRQPLTFETSPNVAEISLTYRSIVKHADRVTITTSNDAYTILKHLWSDKMEYIEQFVVILLSRSNKALGWVKVATGGTSGCHVDTKVVYQAALIMNASGLILSHNHPSGNLKPSEADILITKKLKEAGKLLEIAVLDHLIITYDGYYSFADEGNMS
jgi:DNA repair protein RadC